MTRKYDESSQKYEYPACYPTRDAAIRQARHKYNAVVSEYPGQIEPKRFEDALEEGKYSNGSGGWVRVKMTRVIVS